MTSQDRLLDLMKQGFMKPRKPRKSTPYRLTPLFGNQGRGYGLLYEIYFQGRSGKIGRVLGSAIPNFYIVVDDILLSDGYKTVAQAAKAFVKSELAAR